jgi:pilus assembly protein Flp/PilA
MPTLKQRRSSVDVIPRHAHNLGRGLGTAEPTATLRKHKGEDPMLTNLKKLFKDQDGATAVEYGLIVAAIAGLIIVVVFTLGGKVSGTFNSVQSHMP